MNFDWQDLAFGSKKQVNKLAAVFIAAPREMSVKRFTQLIKLYLPTNNIILGLAKEPYIDGFNGQQQFKTLQLADVEAVIDRVNKASANHKIYTLAYFQRELDYLVQKLDFVRILLVNGSWQHVFHNSRAYYTIINKPLAYSYISPFASEQEAKTYEKLHREKLNFKPGPYSSEEMLALADAVAELSYDYSYQTGAVLGKKSKRNYIYMASSFNKVVPYQTYAMHHGAAREKHFSPANDLNYYDTIHAEANLLIEVLRKKISLKGTTLFINLLPCPTCARMLSQTDIAEFVYRVDHSDGYAVKLLEESGKKVSRVV